jgi:hypothetical protein
VVDSGECAEATGEVAEGDGGRVHWRQDSLEAGYRVQGTGGRIEFRV